MTERRFHVDGELRLESEATVSVRDRGFMYGDGAFETLRVYNGQIFEWGAHADRLERSCETLGFADALPDRKELKERIHETVTANEFADAYAKLMVTRGVQPGKLTPEKRVDPTVVVIVSELPRGGVDGDRVWDRPATLGTVRRRRIPDEALPADAKTHNYLNGILARLELRGTAHDEAVMCSTDGLLTEGATSNLFFVRDGVLHTPSESLPLLPGVTRDVVLDLAANAGIETTTGEYEPTVLDDAHEVFVTNSTWEIRPVSRIDDRSYEIGELTEELQQRFDELIEQLYD